ncbi:MAG TPA: ATP-binding protein [Opitutaceae bacterium]|jgi:NtrC-family two-component system sensor histidine kinase KinB|nr:ATP-binding protein [Opitutaceae bacterium]
MLRTRLYLGLLPLLLLFIAVGLYAIYTCRQLARSIEQDLLASEALRACYDMRDAVMLMDGALAGVQHGDALAARATYAVQRARFEKKFQDQALASSGTARAPLIQKLDAAYGRFVAQGDRLLKEGTLSPLETLRDTESALFATLQAIESITWRDSAELQRAEASASGLAQFSIDFLAAAMISAILLSLYLSYRLARSLLRPIQALKDSAVALGDGRLDRDVPVVSDDELGELARAFNTMAAKLRAYRQTTTEKMLRVQRTMEAMLTSVPDPIFIVSRDGAHELRNPAAEALARSPDFASGVPPALAEPLQRVLAGGDHYLPAGYDRVVTLRVGREDKHFLPRILAIGDSVTGFGGAALLLQDVTKFRLLDDAKSNLVGTVSHELKTPLTSLSMAIYLLLEQNLGQLTAAQRELVETARDDADRLLRILNDLLDLSRLESGVSQLHLARRPVTALLADMAREMRAIVDAAGQAIDVRVAPDLDSVDVDSDRIRHVFINLLGNASKYSPKGTGITLYAELAPDAFVRFGVRDQGPGISAESLPFIFEKFYRVPGQPKKGAGLGLTIAREIVLTHGGSIACASRPGEGSDFYFLLPKHAVNPGSPPPAAPIRLERAN